MDAPSEILAAVLLLTGAGFGIVAGIGLHRMPDFYTRLHAAGIADTLSAGLMLLGMAVFSGFTLISAKLALILIFIFFTSPISSHAVANSAFYSGLRPWGVEGGLDGLKKKIRKTKKTKNTKKKGKTAARAKKKTPAAKGE